MLFSLLCLCLLMGVNEAQGQVSSPNCTPFKFVFEKVDPTPPWPPNSTTTQPATPGAFQTYFTVKLKTKISGSPLPSTWTLNWLAFKGKLTVNGLTSKVNMDLTAQLNPPSATIFDYAKYLSYTETGEVSWIVNTTQPTCDGNPSAGETLNFPALTSEVTLFTIAVDAVEGDVISWGIPDSKEIDLADCITYGCVAGSSMEMSGTPSITFPTQPSCNPPKFITYDLGFDIAGNAFMYVYLNNLTPASPVEKMDGVIHIVTNIPPPNFFQFIFRPDLSLKQLTVAPPRKNNNGTFDIYWKKKDGTSPWKPGLSKELIAVFQIAGIYNVCSSYNITCTTPAARFVEAGNNTCKIVQPSNTGVLDIIGKPPCGGGIVMTASSELVGGNCDNGMAKFQFTHNQTTPIAYSYFKLQVGFSNSSTPQPLVMLNPNNSSPFQCSSCWTTTSPSFDRQNYVFEYNQAQHGNVPIQISNNDFAAFFLPPNGETPFFVGCLEGTPAQSTTTCAITVNYDLATWPFINPKIKGEVRSWNDDIYVKYYQSNLLSIPNPQNSPTTPVQADCNTLFLSYCQSPSDAPFRMTISEVGENYLDGVSTFDLVRISKHVLNVKPFGSPYQFVAADANADKAVSTFDIVKIRKLVLGIYSDLREGQNNDGPKMPSRYFFKSDYQIFDNLGMLKYPYPNANIADNIPIGGKPKFVEVKLGDATGDANCEFLTSNKFGDDGTENRTSLNSNNQLKVYASKVNRMGDYLLIPVYLDGKDPMTALQACFVYDKEKYQAVEVVPNPEQFQLTENNFGIIQDADKGQVRLSWFAEDFTTSLSLNQWLFTIKLMVVDPGMAASTRNCITLGDGYLPTETYTEDGESMSIPFAWDETGNEITPGLKILTAPNPFRQANSTVFIFTPVAGDAVLRVFNTSGQLVYEQPLKLETGENQVTLDKNGFLLSGVYLLDLVQDGTHVTQRVVKN